MGNCQAIDAAALVIQHPNGKIERMFWPVSASEVMKINPGHYVSLIIPLLPISINEEEKQNDSKPPVRFTRVKLLRETDTLVLGHAYRLVTTQDVMKVLRAKKNAKLKKYQPEIADKKQAEEPKKSAQGPKHEVRMEPANPVTTTKSKSWRPSLQSISEAVS